MSFTAGNSNELRIIAARRSNRIHVQEIWEYRELLLGLVNKELKVRYKNSVLGFFWSMAQPVFLLLVYGVAFSILKAGFDKFAVWLMCGLIVWTFAGTTLSTSVQSITANQHLVSKVSFPRAVLPLASLGASLVHFFLQSVAFGIVLLVLRHPVDWSYVWLLPIAAAVLTMFLSSLALLLSTVNVYARDTQHLLDLALQGMFWAIPVLYEYQRVSNWFVGHGWPSWTPLLNPFTPVVITFQRAVYGTSQWWYLRNLGVLALFSLALIAIGLRAFDKAEGNFAEIL
jgi:ABC-2 type transport system permease protein